MTRKTYSGFLVPISLLFMMTFLLYRNSLVPVSQSEILYDTLKKAGVEAELYIIKGAAHGGPAFSSPETIALIRSFFDKHLKKSSAPTPQGTTPSPLKDHSSPF